MNDLDEKLKDIIKYGCEVETEPGGIPIGTVNVDNNTINKIKQAFKDAGYVSAYIGGGAGGLDERLQFDAYGKLKIDGKEFYDRFVNLISADGIFGDPNTPMKEPANYKYYEEYFKVVAKEAAGIE